MNEAARIIGVLREVRAIGDLREVGMRATIDVLDLATVSLSFARGKVSAEGGHAAYEYIERAVRLTLDGQDAIATALLNKEALHLAGKRYADRTEILADLCGSKGTVMLLACERLRVSHVSLHVSLCEALTLLTIERIVRVARLIYDWLVKCVIELDRSPQYSCARQYIQ